MYPLVARCLKSSMYASLPAWVRTYIPVRISAMSLLFFISRRIFYSSIMSSGIAYTGMYMYSNFPGYLNGVTRQKLHRPRHKKVTRVLETILLKRRFAMVRSASRVYVLPSQLTRLPPTVKRMQYGSDFLGRWFAQIRRYVGFFPLGNKFE